MNYTKHVKKRMQQRGTKIEEIGCIMQYGQLSKDGGACMVTRKEGVDIIKEKKAKIREYNKRIKHERKDIELLERTIKKQSLCIVKDGTLVTTFPANDNQVRRKFR